ncbi:MAG: 2-dehydro-3-deoxygalactonokinase [Thermoanaerobacteraceae bacterium]|nr:2-dehydro-3-deoxygalactonokinase [Thermoanaerobacteraceae bacterium]
MLLMTIDGGTTNTRVRVLSNDQVIGKACAPVGVRNTAISGSKDTLLDGLRRATREALEMVGIKEKDLELVTASGMITSNVGIYEVPHISTPAGLEELAAGSRLVKIPQLMDVPILFIPGIKNNYNVGEKAYNLEAMDIMRGEETEALGVLELLSLRGPLTMILPGSHTKIIKINERNQIAGCLTTMAVEIFSTLATETILADSIPPNLVSRVDPEMIAWGAAISRQVGLTRGCFSTRIMSQFMPANGDQLANFLLGVILGQDLIAMKNSRACALNRQEKIVIGGPSPLRLALYTLLAEEPEVKDKLVLLDDATVEISTAVGARKIGLYYLERAGRVAVKS